MFFSHRFLCVFFTFSLFFLSFLSLNEQIHPSLKLLRFTATHHYILHESHPFNFRHVYYSPSDSILFPDYEVLNLLPFSMSLSDSDTGGTFYCQFQNNATSPAKFTGVLPSIYKTYKCSLPNSVRRLRPLLRPILTESSTPVENYSDSPEMLRWEFLAYESLSTETDVILFVKGVNNHRNVNRSPPNLTCVFNNGNNSVITSVTSSSQEVFRCLHPDETSLRRLLLNGETKLKVSLQVTGGEKQLSVPSVAYYTPLRRNVVLKEEKKLICVCTMVYNVAKFLKEWVFYHSRIGVEKFVLYDNGSDDDLKHVVKFLLEEKFDVGVIQWPWPKTQEAGFSHCALQAKDSFSWMMFVDVDEFVFSPSWMNSSYPSHQMLRSLLPASSLLSSSEKRSTKVSSRSLMKPMIGQVMIGCQDFGPSNQKMHPVEGVTQGYTCRKKVQERHKSIVLLDAIDVSLSNVIHHFRLKDGYRGKKLNKKEGVVNHYKYQAWPEFKKKFRRRVSTYVVDWRQKTNSMSKDRTPGLGFEAVEPEGWANRFCEVHDTRLKEVTQKWFGVSSSNGYSKMAWQDDIMHVGSN